MESLIIWIVILAIGFAYDWAKKKHAPSEKGRPKSIKTTTPAPCNASWAQQAHPNLQMGSWPAKEQITYSEERTHKPVPSTTIHKYTPITNLPDNDSHLQVEDLDEKSDMASIQQRPSIEQEAYIAHYSRWRKAIIDTQILERKF